MNEDNHNICLFEKGQFGNIHARIIKIERKYVHSITNISPCNNFVTIEPNSTYASSESVNENVPDDLGATNVQVKVEFDNIDVKIKDEWDDSGFLHTEIDVKDEFDHDLEDIVEENQKKYDSENTTGDSNEDEKDSNWVSMY